MGSYLVKDTPSGRKTLIHRGQRETRLHSAYDPSAESQRTVAMFSKGRGSVIIVAGLALGYHIDHLRERFPETQIMIIEKDREVIDIAGMENPGFLEHATMIDSLSKITPILEELDIADFRGFSVYTHRPSYQLDREFYDRIVSEMNRYMSSRISDLFTRFEFEGQWIRNILVNIRHIFTSHRVASLFGKFRGYPGIIVSAGPSLRKNMDLLEGLRDRALIVCVDTALKVLHRRDITPHLVMTLDAQKQSLKHFLGVSNSKIRLLADLVSCPAVARSFPGDKIFSTTSKYYTDSSGNLKREATPFMGWLEKYLPNTGDIQSGGSVATSAFDLLLNLGCDPIVLTGQDLAYTGREIHCSGTYHNDDWSLLLNRTLNLDTINQRVVRRRKIKYVERYGGGGTVISDFVFDLYRNWFEDSASRVGVPVINATGGGARISNCEEASLESLSGRFKQKDRTPDEIIEDALKGKTDRPDPGILADAMGTLSAELKKIDKDISGNIESGIEEHREILNRIYDSDLDLVLNPFIRKTTTYLKRRDIPPEEGTSILLRDIQAAARGLVPLVEACRVRCIEIV